jgi:hypothetical protein
MTIQKYVWILYGRSMGRLELPAWKVPCKLAKPLAVCLADLANCQQSLFLFVFCHSGSKVLTAGYAGAEWPNTK